jgi:hypothetical protein
MRIVWTVEPLQVKLQISEKNTFISKEQKALNSDKSLFDQLDQMTKYFRDVHISETLSSTKRYLIKIKLRAPLKNKLCPS